MNKTSWIILGIILIVIGIWGFTRDSNEPTSGEPIKIGFSAPLTGAFADWGEAIKRGVILAIEDTNHKFEVDFQDSGCEPKRIVDVGTKFFEVDGIKIIIGPGCLQGLKPLMPLAIKNEALVFSTGLLDNEVLEMYDSNLINFATQIDMEARFVSSYWFQQEDIKDVAVLYSNDSFGIEFFNQFDRYSADLGMNIVAKEGIAFDSVDFRTTALKFVKEKPDLIIINTGEKEMGLFIKQLRELGFNGLLHGTYTAESESMINAGGEAVEGLIYTFPVNSADGSDKKNKFEQRYEEKFGEDSIPNANTFFVYDGILLLDQALDKCDQNDTKCIESFFKNLGNYKGLAGDVSFQENGGSIRPFGIKKIESGEFVWVTKEVELK